MREKEKNSIFNLLRFKTTKIELSKQVKIKEEFLRGIVKFYLLNCECAKYEFKSIFELIFQFTRVKYVCLSYTERKLIGNELPSLLVTFRKNESKKRKNRFYSYEALQI